MGKCRAMRGEVRGLEQGYEGRARGRKQFGKEGPVSLTDGFSAVGCHPHKSEPQPRTHTSSNN